MTGPVKSLRFFSDTVFSPSKKTVSSLDKTLGSAKKAMASVLYKPKSLDKSQKLAIADAAYVDMGSNGGDCGFRSLAAGMIDTLLTHPNPELLSKMLEAYGIYFPRPSEKDKRFLRQLEQEFQALIDSPKKLAQFIVNLSYVLRRRAEKEMLKYPEYYQGAFIGAEGEGTSIELMRQEKTWIDESAIVAVGNSFGLRVELVAVEGEKTVFAPLIYGANSKDVLKLKLEGAHYVPMVNHVSRFKDAAPLCRAEYIGLRQVEFQEPDLVEILAKIEASNEKLNQAFEMNLQRLKDALETGKLDQEALLSAYIKGLRQSDYLQGYQGFYDAEPSYHETQHGTAAFFASIRKNQDLGQGLDSLRSGHESILTHELVHALARSLSIGHMQEEEVFGVAEERLGLSC